MKRLLTTAAAVSLSALMVLLALTVVAPPAEASSLRFTASCSKGHCIVVRYVRDYNRTLRGWNDTTITGVLYTAGKRYGRNPAVYAGGKSDRPYGWLTRGEMKYSRLDGPGGSTAWVRNGSSSLVCINPSNSLGKGVMDSRVCVSTGRLN